MRPSSRVLLAFSAVTLAAAYFLPLWSISLEAPQYPEGIGMRIWVNTITGAKPHDLQNINNLNHYIGMKTIEPDAIPELDFMPWIVGFLMLTGLAAALWGRRWMLFAWFGTLVASGVAGMVDFWLWEYDYGHNLDPTAAIKIPGMSYQPPLIGSKPLLNFQANSWPALGGWVIIAGGLCAALAVFLEIRAWRRAKASAPVLLLAFFSISALAGCGGERGPVPVTLGEDACAHCLMTVSDERYATELLTRTGKVHFFDSVECMANFYRDQDPEQVASMWVTDFHTPSRMIRVDEAFFLRSKDLRSPMGMNLTAFGDGITPETVLNSFMGEILDWPAVVALVAQEGTPGMATKHGGHGEGLR